MIVLSTTENGEPEPVFDFLQRYLKDEYPAAAFLREQLREYLIQGRLVLIFDGLNELLPDEYTARYQKLEEFVLRKYPKNKAIFTCRTLRYTSLSNFNTVAIGDLDNDQIKRFISAYRGEAAAESLYSDLTSGDGFMLRICRNPFMLQMLVRRDQSRPAPETPAQLFREYVHDQLAKVSQFSEQTTDVLREVAFVMQKDGKFAGVVTYEWLQARLPHLSFNDYLQIAHRSQLIDYTPEKSFRFYHQILQEYFAAIAVQDEWQNGRDLNEYFRDYRWEETLLVCVGVIEDPGKFINEVWSLGEASPEAFWLATKAVGSSGNRVRENYYRAIIREAEKYLNQRSESSGIGYSRTVLAVDTVKALSYIDDAITADLLSQALVRHDGWVRELCIQVLGSSRNPFAHSSLRTAVVKLNSFPVLLSVAPYFEPAEWLRMAASSTIRFENVLNVFGN